MERPERDWGALLGVNHPFSANLKLDEDAWRVGFEIWYVELGEGVAPQVERRRILLFPNGVGWSTGMMLPGAPAGAAQCTDPTSYALTAREAVDGLAANMLAVAAVYTDLARAIGPERCEWCDDFVDNGRTHGEDRCFCGVCGDPLPCGCSE